MSRKLFGASVPRVQVTGRMVKRPIVESPPPMDPDRPARAYPSGRGNTWREPILELMAGGEWWTKREVWTSLRASRRRIMKRLDLMVADGDLEERWSTPEDEHDRRTRHIRGKWRMRLFRIASIDPAELPE